MRSIVLAAISTLLMIYSPPSEAFGTINLFGQHAEHEKITRLALRPFNLDNLTLSAIAGTTGSFGAVGAPDRPGRGLIAVQAAHCDGADHLDIQGYPQSKSQAAEILRSCRNWIFSNLNSAVREARMMLDSRGRAKPTEPTNPMQCSFNGSSESPKCKALGHIGLALHASQDFYSHSNWVDITDRKTKTASNPPGLEQLGRSPWLDPMKSFRFPNGLITGCYEGIIESLNCRYGAGQNRVKHTNLNKDTGAIDAKTGLIGDGLTARGRLNGNFKRAVSAAIDDTRHKWQYVRNQLTKTYGNQGDLLICLLQRDNPKNC